MARITIKTEADALRYLGKRADDLDIVERSKGLAVRIEHACSRCGGTGIFHTYGTCYNCASRRSRWVEIRPLVEYARRVRSNDRARERAAAKRRARGEAAAADAAAFLAADPELAAAAAFFEAYEGTAAPADTARSILGRLRRFGSVSPAQRDLVVKLVDDARTRDDKRAAEQARQVAAPTGRASFEAVIVKADVYESDWGSAWKAVYKVGTDDGVWLAFGTVPRDILADAPRDSDGYPELTGLRVRMTATLSPGREPHFAMAKRPRGELVREAA